MDNKKWFSDIDDFLPEKRPDRDALGNYLAEHVYYDGLQPPADERILFYNGIPIGSRGNIVAINGKAKSRKSVIASAIMSAAFCDKFLGFTTKLGETPKVLNFDTEQGLGHWIEGSRRVIRDAGLESRPEAFHSHHTRDCDVETRISLLEFALDLYVPDIVVVDGITDLVYDLNSQEEATRIGGKLMAWSVKYNCLIVAIIHITKGTGYMTGALGTYLEKKCQTAIKCEKDEKDESLSTVSCQYARDKGFPMFGIIFDETAGHYRRLEEEKLVQVGPKAKNGPETKSEAFKAQFLDAVFRLHSAYNPPTSLRGGIQKAGAELGLGRDMLSKDVSAWIEYFKASQAIILHPETGWQRAEIIQAYRAAAPEMDFIERNPVDELDNTEEDLPF